MNITQRKYAIKRAEKILIEKLKAIKELEIELADNIVNKFIEDSKLNDKKELAKLILNGDITIEYEPSFYRGIKLFINTDDLNKKLVKEMDKEKSLNHPYRVDYDSSVNTNVWFREEYVYKKYIPKAKKLADKLYRVSDIIMLSDAKEVQAFLKKLEKL